GSRHGERELGQPAPGSRRQPVLREPEASSQDPVRSQAGRAPPAPFRRNWHWAAPAGPSFVLGPLANSPARASETPDVAPARLPRQLLNERQSARTAPGRPLSAAAPVARPPPRSAAGLAPRARPGAAPLALSEP